MGNAGLGELVWVKRGHVVDIEYGPTGRWTDVERHRALQNSRGRASFVVVCLKGGCLRVPQLSARGRRQEALCVQVQAGGPVSACS